MDPRPWKRSGEDTVVESLRNEFNRLFDRFWTGQLEPLQIGRWAPPVDVSETDEAVLVRAEIPGVDPDKVEITIEGDVLTIRGEKPEQREAQEHDYYRVERHYGSFVRNIQLPAAVVKDKAEAVARHGVLTIRLPRRDDQKPKRVPINLQP
jgi:HSP20 family protein